MCVSRRIQTGDGPPRLEGLPPLGQRGDQPPATTPPLQPPLEWAHPPMTQTLARPRVRSSLMQDIMSCDPYTFPFCTSSEALQGQSRLCLW